MKDNPGVKIELGSHCDSRGSYAYNDALSQRRSNSAVAYIISKGISADRITAKGYGERQLLNKCSDGVPCTEEEHQWNRRTEFKVTGNDLNLKSEQ
jgi:outer membrane protein OmpA-like peptidoglycan-associated protein